jgi:hypothetical protein
MAIAYIDPSGEMFALRRAAVLLKRIRQDSGDADPRLGALEAGVCAIQRAALAGRLIHPSAMERLNAVLGDIAVPSASAAAATVSELLVRNALAETRDILRRLGRTASSRHAAGATHAKRDSPSLSRR